MDKKRAIAGQSDRRISEANLMKLGLIGGSIGGIIGMFHFRHKINKQKFKIGFALFFFLNWVTASYSIDFYYHMLDILS